MSSGVLKIKLGEEYKAKIESVDEFENSVFKDLYLKAFRNVKEIIESDKGEEKIHENYNNIIAFAGERGTGKTSAMLSFAEALREKTLKDYENYNLDIKGKEKVLSNYDFYTVGVIDPSLLSCNSNILEIIIAKMFQEFKKKVEKKDGECDEELKRKLIKKFEEVYENIKVVNGKKDVFEEEALDALLKISASTDLKKNVFDLVEVYLKFMNNDQCNCNGKLILEVDDIDLNTRYAYEMIEQIRKYLIIPNVIILMAVKIEQLSQIVERNYSEEFKALLENREKNISNMKYEDIINMTEKYIVKFIPLERRLYLPKLDDIGLTQNIKIENYEEIIDNWKNGESNVEKTIRLLIYKKTGMMFFNMNNAISYIIPRNLREIVNLISFLCKMGDKNLENLERFKEYFLNNWLKSHMDKGKEDKILEILEKDVREKNKYVVRTLQERYINKIEKETMNKRYKEFLDIEEANESILDFLNNSLNISLGDLLLVIGVIERFIKDEKDKKFIFAIKTVYSFILYEKVKKIKTSKDQERKRLIKDYKILLGGFVYNSKRHKVLEGVIKKKVEDEEIKNILKYFIVGVKEKRLRISVKNKYRLNLSLIEVEEKRK